MAVEEEQTEWHLHSGQYLGEISALCFLHLPPQISSLPILLAGSGSEVLAYNLESGNMIESFRVFEGIRVHGISSISLNFSGASSCTKLDFVLVVFGEKRVKLYRVSVEMVAEVCVDLVPLCSLPRFNHWVLDACFLKSRDSSSSAGSDSCGYIAIGCSDNSVHVWDTCESRMILEVKSPESCLLYSMRLWGDAIETLRVASGTIFNEIIVWEVVPSEGTLKDCDEKSNDIQFDHLKYEAMHISRLVGHEGSIFRITWSSDGSKLVSVSDDRSARIWRINAKRSEADKPVDVIVLFGHNARVWDCCIYNSLIITAGEDCTCRAWGLDGKQLEMIKEHIGRGVWRCLYDPMSSLLITAGFDSSIKVHQLNIYLSGTSNDPAEITSSSMKREFFTSCIPKSLDHNGLMDSKSEYVRCLRFSFEFTLYVATNRGCLYHATLSDAMDVKWTKVIHINEEVPIVCMDLFPSSPSVVSCEADDWVALGDGQGRMTVLRVLGSSNAPKLHLSFNWSAEAERQLLGTFWCKSLGFRYIFTADPRGVLKLWRLNDRVPDSQNGENCNVSLIAKYVSCFGLRIMCLDASFEEEIVVCGDVRGNLILFPLSKDLSLANPITTEVKIIPTCYFKGAHGISTVTSVVIRLDSCQTEIHSTGADGCICHMEYVKLKDQKLLEFIGMKQVRELTSVQSLFYDQNSFLDLTSHLYAIGFASTDFIIWNLITESKVLQIQCGGWRRPYSHYLGDVPELKNCFAYVKDEIIYIHRYWVSDGGKKIFPQNLHVQFHGRELHSLRFIPEDVEPKADNKHDILSRSSWIVTGCEDGTVRLTRYTPSTNNWSASNLLGEHVGGSAVRSICYISKVHLISSDVTIMPDVKDIQESDPDLTENPVLLISAGAKRVLTSWLQKYRKLEKMEGTSACLRQNEEVRNEPSRLASSISFKWLSTDMPTKRSSSHRNSYNRREDEAKSSYSINPDAESNLLQEKEELSLKSCPVEKYEDDWRYLAVTGFLVKHFNSRITVCFIVVACSDATLSLRALILPNRLWFDVASLVPVGSPVLTLQHVVVPKFQPNGAGQTLFGNAYIVISGATDGSIAFWDLTGNIEAFMKRLSSLHQEMFIDFQKRPRTGRGSQGGRWRRSLSTVTQGQSSKDLINKKDGDNTILSIQDQAPCKGSSKVDISEADCCASSELVLTSGNSSSKMSEIRPIHVLTNVHQSGVNCLHVAAVNSAECVNNCFLYHVISGGDDQALQCLTFDLSFLSESPISEIMESESESMKRFILHSEDCNRKYMIRFLRSHKIASAHSSAIKGVWTDGIWVFSTGLDQRIRCWKLEAQGKLVEYTYLIITVPEPEAIDARACDKNHYQIAVAGRGMQVVVFSTSFDTGRR
ncbi:WD repeat-containing protein 6, partial [Cucurbita argyrosperma subsp. sororia]